MQKVFYEWDCETVMAINSEQYEEGDVLEHYHSESYDDVFNRSKDTPADGATYRIVLVCDDDECRSWAYLNDDGTLPEHLRDAYDKVIRKVPKRFHEEVRNCAKT